MNDDDKFWGRVLILATIAAVLGFLIKACQAYQMYE